jgi:hypothetical protein
MRRPVRLLFVAACLGLLALPGCGPSASTAQPTAPDDIEPVPPELLPAEVMGLEVKVEDITGALAKSKRAFADRAGLFSLRSRDLLMATFQVTRANDPGADNVARFRDSVVTQLGSSRPVPLLVGKDTVYVTTGTKQWVAFWFRDRWLLVLSVRDEYDQRRALLRRMLEVQPS